jgi:hypothetical protein
MQPDALLIFGSNFGQRTSVSYRQPDLPVPVANR